MIVAVRAFINYSYINENIDKEYQNIAYIIQRNAYVENFHRSYLQSEYAAYFLGHENNRMYDNEILVRIQTKEEAENQETQTEARTNAWINDNQAQILTPSQQWNTFFTKKRESVR